MTIQEEINQHSYFEHFKAAKDLAYIFPPDHTKRVALQKAIDTILLKIKQQSVKSAFEGYPETGHPCK